MHQQKIKSFLAHFVLDHISIEYLRFSYYLTIEQFKLLQFIYQFTHHHSEGLSLNAIIFTKIIKRIIYLSSLPIYMILIGFQRTRSIRSEATSH